MIEGLDYCIETFGKTDRVTNYLLHRPDLREVVLSPSKKSAVVFTNFVERSVYFLTNDVSDAKEFVKTIDFIKEYEPHNNKLIIASLRDEIVPIFDETLRNLPGTPFDCRCHVYTIDAAGTPALSQPLEFTLKDGSKARIRKPVEEDAVFINKNWNLGNGRAEWMLRGVIRKTPVGAIIEVDGAPACWGLQKKGLGSALIKHLSQKIIEGGGCPYAYIVMGNEASCRMFENVGFHRLEQKYTFIGFSY